MLLRRELTRLLLKEIKLELKQRYVINGILLNLVSTVFVTYLAFTGTITGQSI